MIALVVSVFIAAFLGSAHCAAMCGGLACFVAGDTHAARATAAYNGGRLIAYAILGAIAGTIGAGFDQAGSIVYLYAGQDFADRPGDAAIFEAIDGLKRGGTYSDQTPQIQVTADEARQSVGPDRNAKTVEELIPYYQGAFSASVALKVVNT